MTRVNTPQRRLPCASCGAQQAVERQAPDLVTPLLPVGMTTMRCRRCGHVTTMATADWHRTQQEGAQAA